MNMPRIVLVAVLAAGCSPFDAEPSWEHSRERDREDEDVAALRLDLTTSSLGAGSVLFVGTRRTPADSKYPCTTSFAACVNLAGPAVSIPGLCPSVNLAPGASDPTPSPWDFGLAVFAGEGCSGESANLVCYGAASLGIAGAENKLQGELLAPGANSTQVICIAPGEPSVESLAQ